MPASAAVPMFNVVVSPTVTRRVSVINGANELLLSGFAALSRRGVQPRADGLLAARRTPLATRAGPSAVAASLGVAAAGPAAVAAVSATMFRATRDKSPSQASPSTHPVSTLSAPSRTTARAATRDVYAGVSWDLWGGVGHRLDGLLMLIVIISRPVHARMVPTGVGVSPMALLPPSKLLAASHVARCLGGGAYWLHADARSGAACTAARAGASSSALRLPALLGRSPPAGAIPFNPATMHLPV